MKIHNKCGPQSCSDSKTYAQKCLTIRTGFSETPINLKIYFWKHSENETENVTKTEKCNEKYFLPFRRVSLICVFHEQFEYCSFSLCVLFCFVNIFFFSAVVGVVFGSSQLFVF